MADWALAGLGCRLAGGNGTVPVTKDNDLVGYLHQSGMVRAHDHGTRRRQQVSHQSPSQRQPPALPGGETLPAFADLLVQPLSRLSSTGLKLASVTAEATISVVMPDLRKVMLSTTDPLKNMSSCGTRPIDRYQTSDGRNCAPLCSIPPKPWRACLVLAL